MSGTLYVVATPIGNLEDLTFRALRTLREVDLIAAEDTRRTSKLLAHYEIRKPLVSLREHNEARETPKLVARLLAGGTIALVSDAGTPGIADPGTSFVRAARNAGVKVSPVPGASAIAAALSASGLPADRFYFAGFPPAKGSDRARWFDEVAKKSDTVVFFEAPHRIQRTLAEAINKLVQRPIIAWREISKIYETSVECTKIDTAAIHDGGESRGEFTVVVGPQSGAMATQAIDAGTVVNLFGYMTNITRTERNDAIRAIAHALAIPELDVKKVVKAHVMSGK